MVVRLTGDVEELLDFAQSVTKKVQENAVLKLNNFQREKVSIEIEIPDRLLRSAEYDKELMEEVFSVEHKYAGAKVVKTGTLIDLKI